MVQIGPYKKFTVKDVLFFVFLTLICIIGTVGFMWFAVGIGNGNRIMTGFLKNLLRNSIGIVIMLIIFNVALAYFYSKKQ